MITALSHVGGIDARAARMISPPYTHPPTRDVVHRHRRTHNHACTRPQLSINSRTAIAQSAIKSITFVAVCEWQQQRGHTRLSIPEMSPAETPSFDGYVTSAPSSKNSGVVAPRKADAAQKSACTGPAPIRCEMNSGTLNFLGQPACGWRTNSVGPEDGRSAGCSPIGRLAVYRPKRTS